ncbi:Reverse transcriptase domain-containing protein [Strongyloides ratti]|uniref:Reverse transcriptase domain-containing protein n=1 Tax=Strongyloides ratti TaxID=34506 RepID=A0A090L035_STRRB|nr:Reverse transcriptase domain-containing protein [Strongyloides ratti]CEF61497.1 Reverse transcriptase domain-containing protein [Strongyloides ratti]
MEQFDFVLIHNVVYKLANSEWFTLIDIKQFLLQIPLPSDSQNLIFFRDPKTNILYAFKRMPYGLKPTTAICQRILDLILKGEEENVIIYVDDILVLSIGPQSYHLDIVNIIILKLENAGLVLNKKKCSIGNKQTKYLSHIIEKGKYYRCETSTKSIVEYPRPKSMKSIKRFLSNDHKPLKNVLESRPPASDHMSRYIMAINEYHPKIEYVSGKNNQEPKIPLAPIDINQPVTHEVNQTRTDNIVNQAVGDLLNDENTSLKEVFDQIVTNYFDKKTSLPKQNLMDLINDYKVELFVPEQFLGVLLKNYKDSEMEKTFDYCIVELIVISINLGTNPSKIKTRVKESRKEHLQNAGIMSMLVMSTVFDNTLFIKLKNKTFLSNKIGFRPLSKYDISLDEEDRIEVSLGDLKPSIKQDFVKLLSTEVRDLQNHKLNQKRCGVPKQFSENEKVLVKNVFKKSKFDKEYLRV